MGKKNRKNQCNSGSSKTPLLIVAVAFLVMAGYLVTRSGEEKPSGVDNISATAKAVPAKAVQPAIRTDLIETRPVHNPDYYTGVVAQVYRWAEEIPQAFDALYCYCRCRDNPKLKHKTILTCYTDGHASKCSICLKEGQMAWEMTQKGMTPEEIRIAVDDYYEKLNRSRL